MFFHTDYRAITHNVSDLPVDQLSDRQPHLLPPPWLIDSEGAPYPAEYQKFVPGRFKLTEQENVPEVVVDNEGFHEVTDRSMVDAAENRPPRNLPPAFTLANPLSRPCDPEVIQQMIEKCSIRYDAEFAYHERESLSKKQQKLFAETHRLRNWNHQLNLCSQIRNGNDDFTVTAVNRLYTRALFDTDSEDNESQEERMANEDNFRAQVGESERQARSLRRRNNEDSLFEDGSSIRPRDLPTNGRHSRASSDASVSDALTRMTNPVENQRQTRRVRVRRVIVDDNSDIENHSGSSSSGPGESSSESSMSDDDNWVPGESRSRRRERQAGSSSRNEESQVTERPRSNRKSDRDKKKQKQKQEKKEQQNSRYELRDHSKPSSSKAPIANGQSSLDQPSTSARNHNGVGNGASSNLTFPSNQPSDRSRRYKDRATRRNNFDENSNSLPDAEQFEQQQQQQQQKAASSSSSKSQFAFGRREVDAFQQLPQWMTISSSMSRFPFIPQIGDEVVYIWRGHRLYVEAVQRVNSYPIRKSELSQMPYNVWEEELADEEFCRVDNMQVILLDNGIRVIDIALHLLRDESIRFR